MKTKYTQLFIALNIVIFSSISVLYPSINKVQGYAQDQLAGLDQFASAAGALVDMVKNFVDDVSQLTYRTSDSLTINIPSTNTAYEYHLGLMSGDMFSPLVPVAGKIVEKQPAHNNNFSFFSMIQAMMHDSAKKNSTQGNVLMQCLAGGSIKPSYLFMIKLILLAKDYQESRDSVFFVQELGCLLFRLVLSGDIDISAQTLEQAVAPEIITLLKLFGNEAYDAVESFFALMTGREPAFGVFGRLYEQELDRVIFIFNNAAIRRQFIDNTLVSNNGVGIAPINASRYSEDCFDPVQDVNTAYDYADTVAQLEQQGFEITTFDIFMDRVKAPAALSDFDPNNKLVARVSCDPKHDSLYIVDPAAVVLTQHNTSHDKNAALVETLHAVIVAHITLFKSYLKLRNELAKTDPMYKMRLKQDVEEVLLMHKNAAIFLATEQGKQCEQGFVDALSAAYKRLTTVEADVYPAKIASIKRLIQECEEAIGFRKIEKESLESQVRGYNEQLQAYAAYKNNVWKRLFGYNNVENEQCERALAAAEQAIKKIENDMSALEASLVTYHTDLQSLQEQQAACEKRELTQTVDYKKLLITSLLAQYADGDCASNHARMILNDVVNKLRNDENIYIQENAQLPLPPLFIIGLREQIAAVYDNYVANMRGPKAWTMPIASYAFMLEKTAARVREQNAKLLCIVNNGQELSSMNATQLAQYNAELGYLLWAKSLAQVFKDVQQMRTERPEFALFYTDIMSERFASVRQEFIDAIKNAVQKCATLRENSTVLRYFVQLYAPYLAAAFTELE